MGDFFIGFVIGVFLLIIAIVLYFVGRKNKNRILQLAALAPFVIAVVVFIFSLIIMFDLKEKMN